MSETRTVAVVTGASRGAGRGIAIALGSHGCSVYVTGRTTEAGSASLPGTIHETADAVSAAGGDGIPVRVDHSDGGQIRDLFEQVRREQGRLDILVNNACALHDKLTAPGNFWEKPLGIADMLDVGLRSGYVATYYAAPLMIQRRRGLVIFTSASGSVHYVFGAAYGAQKAGVDKFAADMAVDFKDYNVATMSIWMGTLRTDRTKAALADRPERLKQVWEIAETPELTGHIIWALYNDPGMMEMSGQTVIGAEMAMKYGIKDQAGRQPPSFRDMHGAPRIQHPFIIR